MIKTILSGANWILLRDLRRAQCPAPDPRHSHLKAREILNATLLGISENRKLF